MIRAPGFRSALAAAGVVAATAGGAVALAAAEGAAAPAAEFARGVADEPVEVVLRSSQEGSEARWIEYDRAGTAVDSGTTPSAPMIFAPAHVATSYCASSEGRMLDAVLTNLVTRGTTEMTARCIVLVGRRGLVGASGRRAPIVVPDTGASRPPR